MRTHTKWLTFEESAVPGRKLPIYYVESKRGDLLGIIRWYSPWRRFTFYPHELTVFDADCLQDLTTFINDLMEARK